MNRYWISSHNFFYTYWYGFLLHFINMTNCIDFLMLALPHISRMNYIILIYCCSSVWSIIFLILNFLISRLYYLHKWGKNYFFPISCRTPNLKVYFWDFSLLIHNNFSYMDFINYITKNSSSFSFTGLGCSKHLIFSVSARL